MSLGVSIPIFCGSWTVRTYEDHSFVTIVPLGGGGDATIYCLSPGHAHKLGELLFECGPNVARDHIPTRIVEPPPAPELFAPSPALIEQLREAESGNHDMNDESYVPLVVEPETSIAAAPDPLRFVEPVSKTRIFTGDDVPF